MGIRITGEGSGLAALVGAARRLDTLIVLDNCEHVIAGAAEAAQELVRGCSRVTVLATSREALNIPGEHVYRLPSLDVPPAGTPLGTIDAQTYSAVALFADRARAGNADFALTDETTTIVASTVRRLDGIPLAIELAAARVRLLGVNGLAERLDRRFQLLTTGSRTALPRHQTLQAAFDWSYDLLPGAERALFARLAIFSGGWTLDAAEEVCADALLDAAAIVDSLGSLVDKSLVIADANDAAVRYRLLESSRLYALEKLAQRGETEMLASRHARWVCAFLERADETAAIEPLRHWHVQVEPEVDNVRAGLSYAAGSADGALAGRIVVSYLGYWLEHQTEGRRWVETVLARLPARGTSRSWQVCCSSPASCAMEHAESRQHTDQSRCSIHARKRGRWRGRIMLWPSVFCRPLDSMRLQRPRLRR